MESAKNIKPGNFRGRKFEFGANLGPVDEGMCMVGSTVFLYDGLQIAFHSQKQLAHTFQISASTDCQRKYNATIPL